MKFCQYIFAALILLLYSCGGGTSVPSSTSGTTTTSTTTAATITLTATPSTVTVNGTSSISATVLDTLGANVPDGTTVAFTLAGSNGTLSSASDTTSSGVASVSFTGTAAGSETVTATSGTATNTATITIQSPAVGTIEFTSATPSAIGIIGSGKTLTSNIIFTIKDNQGNAMPDGTSVSFVMSGPSGGQLPDDGGEYIGTRDATPTTAAASISGGAGQVTIELNSGNVPGPVLITATVTVGAVTLTTASTPISIGGGTPTDSALTLAAATHNLEGLSFVNIQTEISVFLADRFGNVDILEGTSVSFETESGAIVRSAAVDSTGAASVTFRTQNPIPRNVAPIGTAPCSGAPTSVANAIVGFPTEWEVCLQAYVLAAYGISTTTHPRDGWATITARTLGEESFDDTNANGSLDAGEFIAATHDTLHEAFLDINDNETHDDGTGTDPFEKYSDKDFDGVYDGANGSWDSDKEIFEHIPLIISGGPTYIATNPAASATFNVAPGGSQTFTLLVGDRNLNYLVGGSTISISASKGTLTGTSSFTFPTTFTTGPYEASFTLTDSDPATTQAEPVTVNIDVTWKGLTTTLLISGNMDTP